MIEQIAEQRREEARRLCSEKGISVVPYGSAFWLFGVGVDIVVADMAWLKPDDIRPRPVVER